MPFISIITNVDLSTELKNKLVEAVISEISQMLHVTIKASEGQIRPEKRRTFVTMLVPLLQQAIDNLDGERVIAYFEELPVENIAVGANIAVFGKPRFVSTTGGGSPRSK